MPLFSSSTRTTATASPSRRRSSTCARRPAQARPSMAAARRGDAERFARRGASQALLSSEELSEVPFLILGNKIDLGRAASEDELRIALGLHHLTTGKGKVALNGIRPIELYMCSVVKRSGYGEGARPRCRRRAPERRERGSWESCPAAELTRPSRARRPQASAGCPTTSSRGGSGGAGGDGGRALGAESACRAPLLAAEGRPSKALVPRCSGVSTHSHDVLGSARVVRGWWPVDDRSQAEAVVACGSPWQCAAGRRCVALRPVCRGRRVSAVSA